MALRRDDDDDTDPDGPSTSGQRRIRETALTDEGAAIAEGSRGAWRLAVLVSVILSAAGVLLLADAARARTVALEVVAPVEKKLDDHILSLQGKRESMEAYVKSQSEVVAEIRADAAETKKMIKALCRASARPAICLGEP
jgi:cell division protein FtsL